MNPRPFAIVTGASSGIGLELARLVIERGHDALIVAEDDAIHDAASRLGAQALQADLSTLQGVDALTAMAGARPVSLLAANAGCALGHDFLEQPLDGIRRVMDTNMLGTVALLHRMLPRMVAAGDGRVLITGSIAGYMTGPGLAIYNATKAFVNLFARSLAEELCDTGVTVTCLQPGPTRTLIFERAGLGDSPIGRQDKDDPADVAEAGLWAALRGDPTIVSGWKSKLQVLGAQYGPASVVASAHRRATDPKN